MINKILKIIFSGMKSIVIAVCICLVVYFAAQTAFNFGFNFTNNKKSDDALIRDVAINIPKGATTKQIAEILEQEGLIGSALMFRVDAKMQNEDGKFHYGEYELNTSMTEDEIKDILMTQGAKKKDIEITIPEGYAIQQIADYLEEQGICTADEFIDAANNTNYDYDFVKEIPERPFRLQGYLFPETYRIREGASAEEIVSKMLAQFDKEFTKEYRDRIKEMGFTLDDAIIMASIIEKEAKVASERPKMASVIYNRLDTGMTLGMCSTVLYALNRIGEPVKVLYEAETKVKSPYNTYINAGLPLGPIANPGREAIQAVLYPDETNYLYFVLKNPKEGSHHFSKTLNEHNNAKNKYLH